MKIIIGDTDKQFARYIISKMQEWFRNNLDKRKLGPAQIFINNSPDYKSIYIRHINLEDACTSVLYSLKIVTYNSFMEIKIDENDYLYGTRIKLKDIVSLINDGNLIVRPYPIFSRMFDYFSANLEEYNILYKEEEL